MCDSTRADRGRLLGQSTAYPLNADEHKDKENARRGVILGKDPDGRFVHQGHENQELGDGRKGEELLWKGWETERDRGARNKDRELVHEL